MDLKDKLIARATPTKVVTIIRALPSAGKSTFAEYILSLDPATVICCADDLFEDKETGEYNFDYKLLGKAHTECQDKFERAIKDGVPNIVVANTNTTQKEFAPYKKMAEAAGYIVFSVVLENRHGQKNNHKVPDEVIDNMRKRFVDSIELG